MLIALGHAGRARAPRGACSSRRGRLVDPRSDPGAVTAPRTDAPLAQLAAAVRAASAPCGRLASRARSRRSSGPSAQGQGDYSTNAAMLLAPVLERAAAGDRRADRRASSSGRSGTELERAEVAGPGLPEPGPVRRLAPARAARRCSTPASGSAPAAPSAAERILIEFVSANPTGPLVAASGRHAAYGDALARILEHHGHAVSREYYFNDAGNQIRLLGESVRARARGEEVPEGGYQGEYVVELAAEIPGAADADVDELAARAVELLLARIKATLERYGVRFDTFFSERTLHEGSPSELERALGAARAGRVTCTGPRARCGCARRASATTRTASWCAPTASRPTWRPTSPTCRTSASAASSAS